MLFPVPIYSASHTHTHTHTHVEHLLFDCTVLQEERQRLIGKISRHDNWPVNKSQLADKYIKHFTQFTNSIDFTKL
jgi:hypothetical protein